MLICIEGGIGAGKSKSMYALRQLFCDDDSVVFVDEPVDKWTDSGILRAMYDGTIPKGTFQLAALMSRAAPLIKAMHRPNTRVIITERSIYSDCHVFAKISIPERCTERAAYNLAYREILTCLPRGMTTHLIFLDAPVALLNDRIAKRGRPSEVHSKTAQNRGLSTEYMEVVKKTYEGFLASYHVQMQHHVDATPSHDKVMVTVAQIVFDLLATVPKLPEQHCLHLGAGIVSSNGIWQNSPPDAAEEEQTKIAAFKTLLARPAETRAKSDE